MGFLHQQLPRSYIPFQQQQSQTSTSSQDIEVVMDDWRGQEEVYGEVQKTLEEIIAEIDANMDPKLLQAYREDQIWL